MVEVAAPVSETTVRPLARVVTDAWPADDGAGEVAGTLYTKIFGGKHMFDDR